MSKLKDEFDYYLQNKKKFLIEHAGKYIVLKNQQILGVYADQLEAIEETVKTHQLGTFLVQHVVAGNEEESVRFHSRVAI